MQQNTINQFVNILSRSHLRDKIAIKGSFALALQGIIQRKPKDIDISSVECYTFKGQLEIWKQIQTEFNCIKMLVDLPVLKVGLFQFADEEVRIEYMFLDVFKVEDTEKYKGINLQSTNYNLLSKITSLAYYSSKHYVKGIDRIESLVSDINFLSERLESIQNIEKIKILSTIFDTSTLVHTYFYNESLDTFFLKNFMSQCQLIITKTQNKVIFTQESIKLIEKIFKLIESSHLKNKIAFSNEFAKNYKHMFQISFDESKLNFIDVNQDQFVIAKNSALSLFAPDEKLISIYFQDWFREKPHWNSLSLIGNDKNNKKVKLFFQNNGIFVNLISNNTSTPHTENDLQILIPALKTNDEITIPLHTFWMIFQIILLMRGNNE